MSVFPHALLDKKILDADHVISRVTVVILILPTVAMLVTSFVSH